MNIETKLALLEAKIGNIELENFALRSQMQSLLGTRDRDSSIKHKILQKTRHLLVLQEKYIKTPALLHPSIDIDAGMFHEITEHQSNIIDSNYISVPGTIEYVKTKGDTYYMFQTYMRNYSGKLCITSGCVQLYFMYDKDSDDIIQITC